MCDYAEAYILVDGTIRAAAAPVLGDPVVAKNIARRNVKVVVPLKYLSNFFRSLEMPLINCKIKLNLTWKKNAYYQMMMVMLYLL